VSNVIRRQATSALHKNKIMSGRISDLSKGHITILSDKAVAGGIASFFILSKETIELVSFSPLVRNFCNLLFCSQV
jgi:hypothetical protein